MRTVRVKQARAGPATYAMVPGPGEPPVAVWRLDHSSLPARGIDQHAHDFPSIVYFEAPAALRIGHREWTVATGDVYVIAPGEVIGRLNPHVCTRPGLDRVVHARALARRARSSRPAGHPLLFPSSRGPRSAPLLWPCPRPPGGVGGALRALDATARAATATGNRRSRSGAVLGPGVPAGRLLVATFG